MKSWAINAVARVNPDNPNRVVKLFREGETLGGAFARTVPKGNDAALGKGRDVGMHLAVPNVTCSFPISGPISRENLQRVAMTMGIALGQRVGARASARNNLDSTGRCGSAGSTTTASPYEPRIRFPSSVLNIFQSIHYLDKPTILVPVGHISAAPLSPGSVKRLAILRVSPAAEAYEAVGAETHRLATVPLTGTVDFQICLSNAAIGVHLVAEAIVLAPRNRVARSLTLAT